MEIERNIQILFEEICLKGYEIINFSKIEGKGLTNKEYIEAGKFKKLKKNSIQRKLL